MAIPFCEYGEIGKRNGLKIRPLLQGCGFDSHYSHLM